MLDNNAATAVFMFLDYPMIFNYTQKKFQLKYTSTQAIVLVWGVTGSTLCKKNMYKHILYNRQFWYDLPSNSSSSGTVVVLDDQTLTFDLGQDSESEAAGFEFKRGCNAFTTIVILGRNSASYWTHSAATAAI